MKVACVQLSSGPDATVNLPQTLALVQAAIEGGAQLVALPECANALFPASDLTPDDMPLLRGDPTVPALQALAAEHSVQILVGSVVGRTDADARKMVNRQLLIRAGGEIQATYDKIHLFDVNLPDGHAFRESDSYLAGSEVVTSDIGHGLTLGHAICYDLRFPELSARLAAEGANVLCYPAAFTPWTGARHWHVLLRARAIETGSYVLAPAQSGLHYPGRSTYGHSLIISPEGEVLAEALPEFDDDVPGVIFANLDPALSERCRTRLPNLANRRADIFGEVSRKAGSA